MLLALHRAHPLLDKEVQRFNQLVGEPWSAGVMAVSEERDEGVLDAKRRGVRRDGIGEPKLLP